MPASLLSGTLDDLTLESVSLGPRYSYRERLTRELHVSKELES